MGKRSLMIVLIFAIVIFLVFFVLLSKPLFVYSGNAVFDKPFNEETELYWNITNYLDGDSNLSTQGVPNDLFFNPEGTKLYEVSWRFKDDFTNNPRIYQYTCSFPWKLETCDYDNINIIPEQETAPQDVFFKPDGTKMYIVGPWRDKEKGKIYQYTCSSPWDLESCNYDFYLSTQDFFNNASAPSGIFFKPDGTRLYEIGYTKKIYQYTCSRAWDLSTCNYNNINLSTDSGRPRGLFFKPDGTKLYEIRDIPDLILEYTCSSPWDLETCSYDNKNISVKDDSPTGVFFKQEGDKFYFTGLHKRQIYQYDLNFPPEEPVINFPENNQGNLNLSVSLNITLLDKNSGLLSVRFYDVSDDSVLEEINNVSNNSEVMFEWENLDYETIYRWYAEVSDNFYSTKSQIFEFSTMIEPEEINNTNDTIQEENYSQNNDSINDTDVFLNETNVSNNSITDTNTLNNGSNNTNTLFENESSQGQQNNTDNFLKETEEFTDKKNNSEEFHDKEYSLASSILYWFFIILFILVFIGICFLIYYKFYLSKKNNQERFYRIQNFK